MPASSSINTTRRGFLQTSLAAGAMIAGGALPAALSSGAFAFQDKAAKPMKILILGGTSFIGPRQVEYALSRGHTITLFNRGRTNPQLFPTVEKLIGDRATGDLAVLKGRTWDAVIDNSATDQIGRAHV